MIPHGPKAFHMFIISWFNFIHLSIINIQCSVYDGHVQALSVLYVHCDQYRLLMELVDKLQ